MDVDPEVRWAADIAAGRHRALCGAFAGCDSVGATRAHLRDAGMWEAWMLPRLLPFEVIVRGCCRGCPLTGRDEEAA